MAILTESQKSDQIVPVPINEDFVQGSGECCISIGHNARNNMFYLNNLIVI